MIKGFSLCISWAIFGILMPCFAQNGPTTPLFCEGENPFWTLELDTVSAVFQRTGNTLRAFDVPLVAIAQGRTDPKTYSLINLSAADTAIVTIRNSICSNNVTQTIAPMTIDILTQEGSEAVLLTGCCTVKE